MASIDRIRIRMQSCISACLAPMSFDTLHLFVASITASVLFLQAYTTHLRSSITNQRPRIVSSFPQPYIPTISAGPSIAFTGDRNQHICTAMAFFTSSSVIDDIQLEQVAQALACLPSDLSFTIIRETGLAWGILFSHS